VEAAAGVNDSVAAGGGAREFDGGFDAFVAAAAKVNFL